MVEVKKVIYMTREREKRGGGWCRNGQKIGRERKREKGRDKDRGGATLGDLLMVEQKYKMEIDTKDRTCK